MAPVTINSFVTCNSNSQAAMRLFCFPYAGGNSLLFRKWRDTLSKNIEVCPVELPGRLSQRHIPPFTRMESLVNAIAISLLPYLEKPFAFFGHSMGGLVSFELARFLRANYNLQPTHLFISGRRPPQIPGTAAPIHSLPLPEFIAQLRRLNGTPTAVLENAELMQILVPILRADFAVLENYTYIDEPPLDCAIAQARTQGFAIFGGLEDKEVSQDELAAWRVQTTNSFQLQMFRGDHFFLHSAQDLLLQSLAQQLPIEKTEV